MTAAAMNESNPEVGYMRDIRSVSNQRSLEQRGKARTSSTTSTEGSEIIWTASESRRFSPPEIPLRRGPPTRTFAQS
jgi:hypothetical protein